MRTRLFPVPQTLALALIAPMMAHAAAPAFEIKTNDRVLLIGDTLLEREGSLAILETRIDQQFADRKFSVRNLAFSADTPLGWSRASFDPAPKGMERLKEELDLVQPTVAILGYGMGASLQEITDRSGDISLNADPARYGAEPMNAERFKAELGQLMDTIVTSAGGADKVRFVLLSPIRHEDLRAARPGLPDPTEHNALLEKYAKAVETLAQERGARFVNAFGAHATPITDNGIHPDPAGYRVLADEIAAELGWQTPPQAANAAASERLRAAIARKNELFFHRWRPANSTYLFGFRKHEQGRNAAEIPQFDPLIALAETEIEKLKATPDNSPLPEPAPTPAVAGLPVPPPRPDFKVADGYQIELWAENPLLEKPTQMNFDAKGRLWVCSSSLYPMIAPGEDANDKILVLEDTDRDGKADASAVFTGGLLLPTGVEPDLRTLSSDGKLSTADGCYVGQSTELLHFDEKGNKRVVLSGFGTEDTHHIIHTLHWGPDGRLFFNQSVYIHSHIETPWGLVRLNSGGVFAYDPRTEKLEVFNKGHWNTWGHQMDSFGQSFHTDGAGSTGVSWGIPGAVFPAYEGSRRIEPAISPGSYPKFAGLEILQSPHFLPEWQGNAITCDFRAHRIVRFSFEDLSTAGKEKTAGSTAGYVAKEQADFIRTDDVSFRPIDVKMGPDGALYIADWSNPVINHGEVDFRDPRRDKHMGRIWRVSKKDSAPVKWQALDDQPNGALFDKLLSPNLWEKEQARRVLLSRAALPDTDVSGDPLTGIHGGALMVSVGAGLWADKTSNDQAQLEAVQIAEALGTPGNLERLAKSADPRIRAIGARYLGTMLAEALAHSALSDEAAARQKVNRAAAAQSAELGKKQIETLAVDADPRVRVEAMRALAKIPTAHSAALVLNAAVNGGPASDPALDYAAWLSINDLAKPWTTAVVNGEWKVDGNEKQLAYGLSAIDPLTAGKILSAVFKDRRIPQDGTGPWMELIGKAGGPDELQHLYDGLLGSFSGDCCDSEEVRAIDQNLRWTTPGAERAITALLEAARLRNAQPAARRALIPNLFHATDPIRTDAIRLAGIWKEPRLMEVIEEFTGDKNQPTPVVLAAIDALHSFGGDEAIKRLEPLTRPTRLLELRRAALVATTQLSLEAGVARAAGVLPDIGSDADALVTWRALLAIKDAATVFAAKLPNSLPKGVAAAGVRAAREIGRRGEALVKVLGPIGGVSSVPTAGPEVAQLIASGRGGDPAKGELVYRRMSSACVVCHAIGGAGGHVGPELTSLGASAPIDYIIQSIVEPNAKVKEGFNAITLTLKDGSLVTGIQSRETQQEVFLRDAAGGEQAVVKAHIVSKQNVGSIMPAGLLDPLPESERWDLFAFLAQLGKPGPFDASKGGVARMWKLYPATQLEGALKGESPTPEANAFTLVDGRLFKQSLLDAAQMLGTPGGDSILAVAQFQGSGKTPLKMTGAKKLWLDGKPLSSEAGEQALELVAGVHTLVVELDMKALPELLRAEAPESRFLGN